MRNYKMKGRKLLGVLLAAALVLGLFPAAAMASETDAAAEIPAASETVNADEPADTAETPVTAGEVGTAENPANEAAAGTAGASEEGGPSEESSATEKSGAAEAAVSGEVPASEAEVQTTAIEIPAALAQAEVQTAAVLDIPVSAQEDAEEVKTASLTAVESICSGMDGTVDIKSADGNFFATVKTDSLSVMLNPKIVLRDVPEGAKVTASVFYNGELISPPKLVTPKADGTYMPGFYSLWEPGKTRDSLVYEIFVNGEAIGTFSVQFLPQHNLIDGIRVSGLISPVAGELPIGAASLVGGEGYEVVSVQWKKLNDGAEIKDNGLDYTDEVETLAEDEKFEEGFYYSAYITLNIKIDDGYKINKEKYSECMELHRGQFFWLYDSIGAEIAQNLVRAYTQETYLERSEYSFYALFLTPAAADPNAEEPAETIPDPDENKPDPDETKPDPDEMIPDPDETKPDPDENKPDPDENKPDPDENKPDPDENKPDPGEMTPVPPSGGNGAGQGNTPSTPSNGGENGAVDTDVPAAPAPVTADTAMAGEPAPLAAAPLAESLPDTNVPLAEFPARTETIEEAATPLAAPLTGSWALVNLLLAVLTGLIIAACAARRVFAGRSGEERSERRGGGNVALILGAVLAAAAAAVFALTEDMSNPVALTDGFTLFMALIAAAQIALALIGGRNNREDAGVRA